MSVSLGLLHLAVRVEKRVERLGCVMTFRQCGSLQALKKLLNAKTLVARAPYAPDLLSIPFRSELIVTRARFAASGKIPIKCALSFLAKFHTDYPGLKGLTCGEYPRADVRVYNDPSPTK
jgi:hypothetical protein